MTKVRPTAGSVEITTRCNAGCVMCPHTLEGQLAHDMAAEDVIKFVAELVVMGCATILPHHLGEPTLHPDYVRIWRSIRAGHQSTHLKAFTNGSRLMDPDIRQCIADCSDYTVVSVDGVRPETMHVVRPGIEPQRILEGFRKLVEMDRRGPVVTQGVWMTGINDHEMLSYDRVWRGRGAAAGYPYQDIRERENVYPNPCSRIYSQVDVRVDGTVGICCRDPNNTYPLGNAHKDPIAQIWYSDTARKFRRDHRAGDISLCRECTWEGIYDGNPEDLE